jgi:pyroglutamyl-peptidase
MNPRCLVTGFEAFDGDTLNPSWLIAQALHGQVLQGVQVHAEQLPCAFAPAGAALHAALRRHRPTLVLALGQAGRSAIGMERVAVNVVDARIADNAGAQPIDEPVLAGAPAAYFSTLPIKRIVATLRAQGIPASVSQTAGTFVCNHLFFHLMHRIATAHPAVTGGFIHLPMLPRQAAGQAAMPSMALETMVAGIRTAIAVSLDADLGAMDRVGGAVA